MVWRLLVLAIVATPKVSFRVLGIFIGIIVTWFLTEVQYLLNRSTSIVADLIPSRRTLYRILVQFCAYVVMLKGVDLRNQCQSLMCDKGESRSSNKAKKGAPHVELLASFDFKKDKVVVFNIGINTTGNRTIDAVEDIDDALSLWYSACGTKVLLHNQFTDADSGGARDDLYWKLKSSGRIDD